MICNEIFNYPDLTRSFLQSDVQEVMLAFIEKNHLPVPNRGVWLNENGTIRLSWFPTEGIESFFNIPPEGSAILSEIDIFLPQSGQAYAIVDWYEPLWGGDNHCLVIYELDELHLRS